MSLDSISFLQVYQRIRPRTCVKGHIASAAIDVGVRAVHVGLWMKTKSGIHRLWVGSLAVHHTIAVPGAPASS